MAAVAASTCSAWTASVSFSQRLGVVDH